MAQLPRFHRQPVQRAGHDAETPVPAFRRPVAEGLVEIQQFVKGRPAHHVHDALIVQRALLRQSVGAVGQKLVGEIPAADDRHAPAEPVRGLLNQLAQTVVLAQGQAGQADAHQLVIFGMLVYII